MNGIVFAETLRRSWRGALYWGLGFALYALLLMLIVKDANILKQYGEIAKAFPPALMQLFGGDATALATPEGFLAYGFFGYLLLVFAVYSILSGLNVTANEEDQGILDVVLSLPLARGRLLLEKFAAYALLTIGIIAFAFIGLILGLPFTALTVDSGRLLQATFNMVPSALLMLAFTTLAGALFRSKGTATAVAALFVIGSYVLNFLGEAASSTVFEQARRLSFFSYYDHNGVMLHGLAWGNVLLLLVVSVALVAGAAWFFQRRDVGI
jgi:ABC-2 type transport system permease protein